MQTFVAGQDITIVFELTDGVDLIHPDSSVVNYTVLDNDGTQLSSAALSLSTGATKAAVPVSSTNNVKSLTTEMRFVEISFVYGGQTYRQVKSYRLISWAPISISPEDVRQFLLLTPDILPDSGIDIQKAYEETTGFIDEAVFTDGTSAQLAAHNAVLYRASLNALRWIEFSLPEKEQADNRSYQRYKEIDFDGLRARASNLFSSAITDATSVTRTEQTLLLTTSPTDPVTGT